MKEVLKKILEWFQRYEFSMLGSVIVGVVLLSLIRRILSLFHIRLPGALDTLLMTLAMILGFFVARWLWKVLPLLWEQLKDWLQRNRDQGYTKSAGKPGIKGALFLLLVFGYLYDRISRGLLALLDRLLNWVGGRRIYNYEVSLNFWVTAVVVGLALLLTVLFWTAVHKSAFCRGAAAVLALVCVILSVGAFLDLKGISTPGEEVMGVLMMDSYLGMIVPISLPDWGVVLSAAPALVLSYYGCSSRLERLARFCKYAAFGLILLSATAVCTISRLLVWRIFH